MSQMKNYALDTIDKLCRNTARDTRDIIADLQEIMEYAAEKIDSLEVEEDL